MDHGTNQLCENVNDCHFVVINCEYNFFPMLSLFLSIVFCLSFLLSPEISPWDYRIFDRSKKKKTLSRKKHTHQHTYQMPTPRFEGAKIINEIKQKQRHFTDSNREKTKKKKITNGTKDEINGTQSNEITSVVQIPHTKLLHASNAHHLFQLMQLSSCKTRTHASEKGISTI